MTGAQSAKSLPVAKAWNFCPRCGAAASARRGNPFRCNSCSYAHYFGPCAAVGAIIADTDDKVLLLVRGRDPGKGLYGIPGGFVDPGETAEHALQREVFEEVRLRVTGLEFLCSFPNDYQYAGVTLPVMDVFFCALVKSFDGMKAQAGEIADWQFCRPTRSVLNRMAFESNRRALLFFAKHRKRNRSRPE